MSTKFFPFYAFFSGMPPYNVLKWGKQTGRKANAMDYIYLDNAASAPLREEALEAMLPWLTENPANASSLHSPGQRARKAIENARRACAKALDAKPEEIFFTSGGTESNVAALRGVFAAGRAEKLVTTKIEHHSILHTAEALEKSGASALYLSPDGTGRIAPEACGEASDERTLLSVQWANNEIGTIEPIAGIARAAHAKGALVHTDCVQAGGHVPLSLDASGVDLASFSAHKFGGPKGVGILYIRRGTPFAPLLTGGGQERGMRAGTENTAGIVGLAKALELACAEQESEGKRLRAMRAKLEARISQIPRVHNNVRAENTLPGIANFSFEMIRGENIQTVMDSKGIAVSPGSACASGVHEPSHVLAAIGLSPLLADGAVRISFGYTSKASDIERIAQALAETAAFLRHLEPDWREE